MDSLRIWVKQRFGKQLTEDEVALVQHNKHIAMASTICKFVLSQPHTAASKWILLNTDYEYDLYRLTYYTESLLQSYVLTLKYDHAYAGRYIVVDYKWSK
jgi:hypothetical protein